MKKDLTSRKFILYYGHKASKQAGASKMASLSVQAIVEQYARATAAKMESYVQSQYNVPDFKLKVIVSYGKRRRSSWGGMRNGKPFINLVCKRFAAASEAGVMMTETEYAHIRNDPVIGEMKDVPWETALAGLIAHEIAHAVQFFPLTKRSAMEKLGVKELDGHSCILKNHNWFWQRIYADLRTEFVNGKVTVTSTPIVVTPPPSRPQRTVNKGWKVVRQQNGKARFSFYYTTSDELIGVLCVTPDGYFRYYPDTQSVKKLNVKNFNEARKIEFGI